ncbi:hypothetical protein H6503_00060 [Candidatus Woesearchaeota archaeon]|nr:hypothetical protein [Candidatus Woesearchaeota archaeon]
MNEKILVYDHGLRDIESSLENIMLERDRRSHFQKARRIVVKAGSNVVTTDSGLNINVMNNIARELSELAHGKYTDEGMHVEVAYITSGAEKAAKQAYRMKDIPESLAIRRHLCGRGHLLLMEKYEELFKNWGQDIGMAWPTWDHINQELKETLEVGWRAEMNNTIYVINYNDPLDDRELRRESKGGGNDDLSARIAQLVEADLLILLTDTDGLYDSNPKVDRDARLISRVESIDPELLTMAGNGNSANESKGGMRFKIHTTDYFKGDIVIANGKYDRVIQNIMEAQQIGTYIPARR